jgi:transposase
MIGERFERWFEFNLLNRIKAGRTITDQANFHRKKQLEKLCVNVKVNLLFLPECSPDFNPTGKDRTNMKRALRNTAPFCDLLQSVVYDYRQFVVNVVQNSFQRCSKVKKNARGSKRRTAIPNSNTDA